ncbi:Rab GTPase-activating protein 1, partial [Dissostichus eleginoides]
DQEGYLFLWVKLQQHLFRDVSDALSAPLIGYFGHNADGCCRIQARYAPLQMCQISSSILLSLPDAHTGTADSPLRFLDTQLSDKVAHHPQR